MGTEFIKERPREVPVIRKVDVVVAGGGVAGISAAVSSARNGAKTLLVEQGGFLGGTVTACPMKWIGGYNPKVHAGILADMLDRMKAAHGIGREFHSPNIGGKMIEVSLDIFKEVGLAMLEEAGAEIFLHSLICDAVTENEKIGGILVENKSGRQAILAKVFIDATGDGDVAFRAGAVCEKGRPKDGKTQGMTLCGPTMDDVDGEKLWKFLCEYRRIHSKEIREWNDEHSVFAVSGFLGLIERAKREDDFRMAYDCIWLNGKHDSNQVELSGSFISDADGTDVFDLTHAEIESVKQISEMVAFVRKYIPGFEKSVRMDRGSAYIGVRETRRVVGGYVLTEDDILQGRRFDDVIAKNSTPMDLHNPEGNQNWILVKPYDIPYRCLVVDGIDNLLVAGRCISVTHRALASVRFVPCCMATGQAAGVAASMAAKTNAVSRKINTAELQKVLKKQGVVI